MSDNSREKSRKTVPPTKSAVKATKKTLKHWVAVALFAAIIVVFAFWGVNFNQFGMDSGGVAATVNSSTISMAEFQQRVENIEQNARGRLDQFPESQRQALQKELRQRALDELVMGEIIYQAASKRGVRVPDAEVRDAILQIPGLQENGRFLRDRYYAWLQNMNISTEEFETEVRKQLVSQKLQELFAGSALPTREELSRTRELSQQKVNIKFVQMKDDDLSKTGLVSDADVDAYAKAHKADIEKYYNENVVEFTQAEKVHARHILLRPDSKRDDKATAALAEKLKSELTTKNFAAMAAKYSDDPGSKTKGGDLGDFERGRMVPDFEKAAFSLPVGKVSDPVKTSFGYHLILVESHTPAGKTSLEKAEPEIARTLYVRAKQTEMVDKIRAIVQKGDAGQVDALVKKAGLKWTESGEFDLSSQAIPKLGEGQDVMRALMKHGTGTGLVHELIRAPGGYYIVDLTSWKKAPPAAMDAGGKTDQMVAFRKSSDLIETWAREAEAKAHVQKNPQITQ